MSIFNQHAAELLILLFFIITYLFSVTEKLADWKGTVVYYTNHFKGTILEKIMTPLLINIVIFEMVTFILLVIGIYFLTFEDSQIIAKVGLELSALTLLFFLTGQRIAKDYPGAMNITVYFILNCIGIFLLT
ncbi:DoxX family protein [Lutibacter sp.]|uniref:DoxX family protein n=1 Tax=Lutibacter sp. TaxID=1925666 RepID=UPI001A2E30C3|nr:DoxX family protein [Lutibacter sp.]MBI9040852.1 DoxX family protein [Lutibacter sp.]